MYLDSSPLAQGLELGSGLDPDEGRVVEASRGPTNAGMPFLSGPIKTGFAPDLPLVDPLLPGALCLLDEYRFASAD